MSDIPAPPQRIDKWLWHARMFRTRSLASRYVATGKLRANGVRISKASYAVTPGDVLTFVLSERVRVLKILALAERRGPFSVACELYEDLSPPVVKSHTPRAGPAGHRPPGAGRPTKLDRRRIGDFTTPNK
ncbi:MAG: RNA-binding S4 domain-containing protein [Rhizobiales bacterium]|nr:RNA-binding S4 domain-containing protein [Hyphomicrobiales bacterium]